MKTEQEILDAVGKGKEWVKDNFCDKIGKQYIEGFVDGLEYLKEKLLDQEDNVSCRDCRFCKYDPDHGWHWTCMYNGISKTISLGKAPGSYIPDWCPLEGEGEK